jgi:hypothetical protein
MNLGDLQNKISEFIDIYGIDKDVVFTFEDNSYDIDDEDIKVFQSDKNDIMIAFDIDSVIEEEIDKDDIDFNDDGFENVDDDFDDKIT